MSHQHLHPQQLARDKVLGLSQGPESQPVFEPGALGSCVHARIPGHSLEEILTK